MLDSPDLTERCRVLRDVIEVPATGSLYRVLSAEAYSKEGLNPTRSIIDELHAHPTDDLFDVLRLASGGRVDPLLVAITTAGVTAGRDGRDSICYRLFKHGAAVADGTVDDGSFFFCWWGAPDGADHLDPAVWQAANPGYGDLLDPEDFAATAKTTQEPEFRAKRLNQWVATSASWLPAGAWAACAEPGEQLRDGDRVVLGFDGSHSNDATAIVAVRVGDRPFVTPLRVWERPGDAGDGWRVPVLDVEDEIRQACRRFDVAAVVCDPARWARSLQLLEDEGLPVEEFPQSPARMVPATARFYEAVVNGAVRHDGGQLLARHLRNCVTKVDARGVRIVKDQAGRKIDAAVAAVMAFDRAAQTDTASAAPTVWSLDEAVERIRARQAAAREEAPIAPPSPLGELRPDGTRFIRF